MSETRSQTKPRKWRRTSPTRVTVNSYTNKRGDARVSILLSREMALRIAMNDPETLTHVQKGVETKLAAEESPDPDGTEANDRPSPSR